MAISNVAAHTGPQKFPWWLDWRGECVAIVASGPSTKRENLSLLKDRIHVIAIKNNFDLCPWADVVYGCDLPWWKSRRGLPEFKGLKVCYSGPAANKFGLKRIDIKRQTDKLLVEQAGLLGDGGNSGFQALNIAVQFGATGVLLIGFDVNGRSGLHWYGRNQAPGQSNPSDVNFQRWARAFNDSKSGLDGLGVDVVNASAQSGITAYRKAGIAETLERWGL